LDPLRVFENRALRRIFGPKREEVAAGWRKLHMRSFIIYTLHWVLLLRVSIIQGG
jgi:hypothetical protein